MLRGKKLTQAFVGLGLFSGLMYYIYWACLVRNNFMIPAIIFWAAALYETYSLINGYTEDTISETFWDFSDRYPVFPFAIGALQGLLLGMGYFHDPAIAVPVAVLDGHFFFPRYGRALMAEFKH